MRLVVCVYAHCSRMWMHASITCNTLHVRLDVGTLTLPDTRTTQDDENTENEENDAKNQEPPPPKVGPAQRTLARFRLFLGPRYAKVFNFQQGSSRRNVSDLGASLKALGGMPGGPKTTESGEESLDPLKQLALAAANKAQLDSIVPEEDRYKIEHLPTLPSTYKLPPF